MTNVAETDGETLEFKGNSSYFRLSLFLSLSLSLSISLLMGASPMPFVLIRSSTKLGGAMSILSSVAVACCGLSPSF